MIESLKPQFEDPWHTRTPQGLVLVIPGEVPPGMNTMLRMHHMEYRRVKRDWYYLIMKALGRNRPEYQRARITMTMYRLGEMDRDNRESCFKMIGDSLRDMGVISNDDPESIETKIQSTRVRTKADVRTVIEIQELKQ